MGLELAPGPGPRGEMRCDAYQVCRAVTPTVCVAVLGSGFSCTSSFTPLLPVEGTVKVAGSATWYPLLMTNTWYVPGASGL